MHLTPPIWAKVRGWRRTGAPPDHAVGRGTACDALFELLPIAVDAETRGRVGNVVLHAGFTIPPERLCLIGTCNVSLGQWLDDVRASDMARLVLEFLAGADRRPADRDSS